MNFVKISVNKISCIFIVAQLNNIINLKVSVIKMIFCDNCIWFLTVLCLSFVSVCNTQLPDSVSSSLHTGLTERIGNFSLELLYYATQDQPQGSNLIISPITVWTALAVLGEGASGKTKKEIFHALRISSKNVPQIREDYQKILKWLTIKTETVEIQKFNALFIDEQNIPLKDFQDSAKEYDMRLIPVDFTKADETANLINTAIANVTHNRIPSLLVSGDLQNVQLILTSAIYFKGQWKFPFDPASTSKEKFYDSHGKEIGEVMMMNKRSIFPYAKIDSLEARVIEIPYGNQNRTSMLVLLPEKGITLEKMFLNFQHLTLDMVFEDLRRAQEEYGEDEIDFHFPRFKIETSLDLISSLENMDIKEVFSETQAELPHISHIHTFVSKVIHKAEIEVNEEGTIAAAVTQTDFMTRIGGIRVDVNRPFCYMIIEKVTNTIAFGGFYQTPSIV